MSKPKKTFSTSYQSLVLALRSWRTASVTLLSFSSGLPLGMVWIAIPDWMRSIGVDIRIVGLFALTQLPWTFKVLWAPLMDRFVPPFWGRRRGWALITQIALAVSTLLLAGVASHPDSAWIVGALALSIAMSSATQDIALDAYAVDVLRENEQGVVVGARIAVYRAAMYVAGALSISLAGQFSWKWVNIFLALLYVPMMLITWKAPEPEEESVSPKSLKEAVWGPFLGFLSKHRSIEILIFVILYKFGDNLAQGLLRPFLVDMGYSATQRGVALGTIGLVATLSGTFVGGISTNILGLGHCLWLFGFLQVFSNIGYVFLAKTGVDLPLFYGAMAFETFTQGLGTGAFSVLLIRMTQKRFSATQYALFSSTFGLARVLAGPLSGFMVDALGWVQFFWASIGFGIPGLILLQRFSPLGERDPHIHVQAIQIKEKASKAQIVSRAWFGLLLGMLVTSFCMGCLNYAKAIRTDKSEILSLGDAILRVYMPQSSVDWIQTTGVISFALAIGLIFAAHKAARGQN